MEVGGCAISRSWIASFCVVHGLTDDTTYALDVLQIDSEGRQTPVVEGLVVATSSHSIESAIASPAQAAAERDRLAVDEHVGEQVEVERTHLPPGVIVKS
jgi:hypothetical protein